ncbi:MAG: ATP-binding protein [bacterium]
MVNIIKKNNADLDKHEILLKNTTYIKQLNCLYGISRIVDEENRNLFEILQKIANILPHSSRYSECACASIVLDGFKCRSTHFRRSQWALCADITPHKKKRGNITIYYKEKKPEHDEGPFLKEERILLNAVAERVSKIVERIESTEYVRKARDIARKYMDIAGIILIVINRNGIIIQANQKAQHILKRSQYELIGKNWFETCLPQDNSANKEAKIFKKLLSGNKAEDHHYEGYVVDSQGEKHLIEWNNAPISDESGNNIGILYSGNDITEKRTIENELKTEREKLKAIVSGVNVGLSILDKDMNILWTNKAIESTLKDKRIRGKKCYTIYKDREQICEKCPAVRAFHTGRLEMEQEIHVVSKNEKRIYRVSASPLLNEKGEPENVIEVLEDITDITRIIEEKDRKHLQLIQAEKMASLGRMVSGIAHEINNPTTFIMLNFPVIKQFIEDIRPILDRAYRNEQFITAGIDYMAIKERLDALMDGIACGIERIHKITYGLKEFSRQEISNHINDVNINLVIEQTMLLIREELSKRVPHIKKILAPDLPLIKGKFYRLEQVITNILLNASHAIHNEKGEITIITKYIKNAILIKISDNGCGMNQEIMNKIFDPFYTTKGSKGGTGLGLSISYNIIKEHGGDISVSSEEGKGSTFSIYLPAP